MIVTYKNNKLKRICENKKIAEKTYGALIASKIKLRIVQLESSTSLNKMLELHIGRCHKLIGNRNEQYAMDLVHPYRLIFKTSDEQVEVVQILEIVDYH